MAGRIRLVHCPPATRRARLARWLEALEAQGRRVVVLTWDAPYEQLRQALASNGFDPARLFILDAVGGRLIGGPRFLPNAFFVESPVLLEQAAARAEAACRRIGPGAHVVLDSLNLLALYNPPDALREFVHRLASRLRVLGVDLDLVLLEDRQADALSNAARPFVDGTEPMGDLASMQAPAETPRPVVAVPGLWRAVTAALAGRSPGCPAAATAWPFAPA